MWKSYQCQQTLKCRTVHVNIVKASGFFCGCQESKTILQYNVVTRDFPCLLVVHSKYILRKWRGNSKRCSHTEAAIMIACTVYVLQMWMIGVWYLMGTRVGVRVYSYMSVVWIDIGYSMLPLVRCAIEWKSNCGMDLIFKWLMNNPQVSLFMYYAI